MKIKRNRLFPLMTASVMTISQLMPAMTVLAADTEIVKQDDGSKVYYKNGEAQKDYTGLVNADDAWFYVEKGVVVEDKVGYVDYEGSKFLVVNGKLADKVNGLSQDPEHTDDWYFCSNGQVQTQYTGLALYDGEWFYINKGKLDTKLAAYVEYDGGLFYVAAGRILKEVSGLAQDPNGPDWYFLAEGQAQTQYTGLAFYDGEWFYVINGKLAEDYTGSVEYDGATFDVVNGMVAKNGDVVVPTPAPEVTPEVTPIVTPEATPEATPQVTPETTPTATPEVIPEATPEATPEVTPEVTPETTPTTTPEVTPETTPTTTPTVTPEATPKSENVEETVVDGIIHHAFKSYEFSDAEEAFLDDIIEACQNGDEKSAAEMLIKDEFTKLGLHDPIFHTSTCSQDNVLYKGYKFYVYFSIESYGDERRLLIIPVESGKGFMLNNYREDLTSIGSYTQSYICYGNCECQDGMMNGAFSSKKKNIYNGKNSYNEEREGFVKNGLADGKYVCRVWEYRGENTLYYESGNVFDNGTPTVLEKAKNGTGYVAYWLTHEYYWIDGKKVAMFNTDYSELIPSTMLTYYGPEGDLFILTPAGTVNPGRYTKYENGDISVYPW